MQSPLWNDTVVFLTMDDYGGWYDHVAPPNPYVEAFHATGHLSDLDPAARDGQANDLMDMFDWSQAPLAPLVLPRRTCPRRRH